MRTARRSDFKWKNRGALFEEVIHEMTLLIKSSNFTQTRPMACSSVWLVGSPWSTTGMVLAECDENE